MGYDGTIQFDVAMDLGQFQQGIEEISLLLENMQIEGLQQRILEQLNVGEKALELGTLSGTQFVEGFLMGMSLLSNGQNLFSILLANLPAQAFMQGQLADEQFASGMMSGQSNLAAEIFISSILTQLMTLPLLTQEIAYETVLGFAEQMYLGTENILLATTQILTGILQVLSELPLMAGDIAIETGMSIMNGLMSTQSSIFLVAANISQGIASTLGELPSLTAGIMPQVFNNMAAQMDQLAPSLYNRAATIANNIANQLSAAFSISAPSTSTGGGTKNSTQNGRSARVAASEESSFMRVQSLASDVQKEFLGNKIGVTFSEQLGNSILQNRSNSVLAQQYTVPSVKGAGNSVSLGGLTQNFYSPQAPTPAQATQQGIAFLEQARWKLPQMSR